MIDHNNNIMLFLEPISLSAAESSPAGPSTPSIIRGGNIFGNRYNTCTVKIVKADKKISAVGKADFFPLEAMYIELKASTANISYVRSVVQERWGEKYIVVSYDGMQIGDSSVTQG